jgi:sugar lactone lactonase YvrE
MKTIRTWLLAAAMGLGAQAASVVAAQAAAGDVLVADARVFPESITSTKAGDLIFGSMGKGGVYRAKAGESAATLWIAPEVSGITFMAGVFADDASDTLYACSGANGAPPEQAARKSAVRTFDLTSGAAKASYPMPYGAKSFCNDFALDRAGNLYVTDTVGGAIHRLKKGGTALEEWIKDPRLAGADGVAVGGDGAVYVNSVFSSKLFRVAVNADGSAGAVTELTPSMTMNQPDGLRALGGLRFLQAEGGTGRIDLVVISGDTATITPIKQNEPGLTAMTVARGKVWALNGKLNYMRDKTLQGQDPGPVGAEAVDLPK